MEGISQRYIQELLQFVRTKSPYYRSLWAQVPEGISSIEDLPLTDSDDYWTAARDDQLLTGPINDGIIVRTGGTTAEPKVVYMTREEVKQTLLPLAHYLSSCSGIRPGDRLANLFHIGGMYAGFVGVTTAMQDMHMQHVHLPITGNESIPDMAHFLKMFDATVILSNVFTVSRVAAYLREQGETIDSVHLILYMGESFYNDILPSWLEAFPNMRVRPMMYAAVDGGIIGLPVISSSGDDDPGDPVYQVSSPMVLVEILDEDGKVITEPNRRGRLMLTDCKRRLQPTIRYPIGDNAEWVDHGRMTFRLLGRESIALKVGSLFLSMPTLRSIVRDTFGESKINSFQLVVRRMDGKSEMTFRLVADPGSTADQELITRKLEQRLITEAPKWQEYLEVGYIQPLRTEWVKEEDLSYSERSGKLREVVEERFG
ncbi:unnamed protein product [Cercospora beticola]|nr:unnamed protein product [Cercospora beticola]